MISKKTILFSGNTLWSMYNFRKAILEDFIKNNFNVVVVAPEDEFVAKIQAMGCTFIPIKIAAKGVNPVHDFLIFISYLKIFKKIRPDFCFFYTIKPNIYGSLAARLLNLKHVPVTTGLGYIFLNNGIVSRIVKRLYKIAFRKAKQIWFLNQEDYTEFLNEKIINPYQGYVLKSGEGIDLKRFFASPQPNSVSFLLMARMLWDKGVGLFVEAAEVLKQEYPDVQFNLLGFIGVDNPSAIPKKQINKWEKGGIINYLGVTNDVRPFIDKSSCVVLPSYYREGVPLCLLEGAAMAKPLITTDAVGCRETVDDGINGFICKVKDAKSLQEAMRKIILMSKEKRLQMGLSGRKKIERVFDVRKTIEKYYQIISEAC
ncbi:MAG: glycosyltransferase family 4 protein [Prevotellaceae bacterium]|nr:glycosyltransferase family 4 protein [Prevotellaceae bacterium]